MKYLVLIQARCGSSRLPNKVMKDPCGKKEIERVVERVKRSCLIDEVMVITSTEENNLPMIALLASNATRIFVGSENDVLDRYYQAARLIKPEYVIRVTADCPVFDWRYLDMAIKNLDDDTDYMSGISETFPDGLDVEIIRYSVLETAYKKARLASEREHVTMYIKNNPDKFNIKDLKCPIDGIGNKRWTLDEDEDYELILKIYEHFVSLGKEDFVTEDILSFLAEHPELEEINKNIMRNEGLAKSLKNDYIVERDD